MQVKIGTCLWIATITSGFFLGHISVRCQVTSCNPAAIGSNHHVVFKVNSSCNRGMPQIYTNFGVLVCPNYTLTNQNENILNVTSLRAANHDILTVNIYNISMKSNDAHLFFYLNDNTITDNNNKKCIVSLYPGQDRTHIDIGILVSIVEAVLLVISWIIVAFLCLKQRRYTNSKGTLSVSENAELKQIRETDDGYLTPIDLTNVNIGQQARGDYDSIEPHHGYETISRGES